MKKWESATSKRRVRLFSELYPGLDQRGVVELLTLKAKSEDKIYEGMWPPKPLRSQISALREFGRRGIRTRT